MYRNDRPRKGRPVSKKTSHRLRVETVIGRYSWLTEAEKTRALAVYMRHETRQLSPRREAAEAFKIGAADRFSAWSVRARQQAVQELLDPNGSALRAMFFKGESLKGSR